MYVWIAAFVVLLANSARAACGEEFDKVSAKNGTGENGVYTGADDIVKVVFKFDNLQPFEFDTLTVDPLENIDVLSITGKLEGGGRIKAKFTDVPSTVTEATVIQKTGDFDTAMLKKLIVSGKSKNGGAPKFQITASTACLPDTP